LPSLYHFSFDIKSQNSKLAGSGFVNASNAARAALEAHQLKREIPPLKDLLNIAAMLAIGRPLDDENLRKIAEQAMKLWEACLDGRKQTMKFVSFREKSLKEELVRQNEIPKPKKFPVTFDDFLRLMIGGRYKANRVKIYRDYVKELIRRGHASALANPKNHTYKISLEDAEKLVAPASLDEISDAMQQEAAKVITHEQLYLMRARDFLEWRAKQPTERAKKAAAKRWNKKKLMP
jgi:hypothetical protein